MTRALRLLLFVFVAGATPAAAQMLPAGTWTGTWTAGSRAHEATALIERCETGVRVVLGSGTRQARTETATWTGGRLRFTTDRARMPGMPVAREMTCELARGSNGRLAGACRHGLRSYRLVLAPPANGAFGCDG